MVKCKCGGNSYATKIGLKCRACKSKIGLVDSAIAYINSLTPEVKKRKQIASKCYFHFLKVLRK